MEIVSVKLDIYMKMMEGREFATFLGNPIKIGSAIKAGEPVPDVRQIEHGHFLQALGKCDLMRGLPAGCEDVKDCWELWRGEWIQHHGSLAVIEASKIMNGMTINGQVPVWQLASPTESETIRLLWRSYEIALAPNDVGSCDPKWCVFKHSQDRDDLWDGEVTFGTVSSLKDVAATLGSALEVAVAMHVKSTIFAQVDLLQRQEEARRDAERSQRNKKAV